VLPAPVAGSVNFPTVHAGTHEKYLRVADELEAAFLERAFLERSGGMSGKSSGPQISGGK